LVFGFPAGHIASATAGEPGAGEASLAVASEPSGAIAYVDGEAIGATPVELGSLPAGDHRVRVVKDGYLENSRVVSVAAGQGHNLHVKLTPDAGRRAPINAQVEPGAEEKGGGGSKLPLILLGVAAVGAGVYFATKGGNKAPVAAASVNAGGTALMGATAVSFSGAGSSDEDGDTLTYSWNFGDGATGTGQTTTHVYTSAGSFNVVLTVSDGEKSSTASATVNVRNVTGTWDGLLSVGADSFAFVLTLSQSGDNVSGAITPNPDTLSGSVSAPRDMTLAFNTFCDVFELTANADVTSFEGTTSCTGFPNYGQVRITRQ
jgi:PKD repeat protein